VTHNRTVVAIVTFFCQKDNFPAYLALYFVVLCIPNLCSKS